MPALEFLLLVLLPADVSPPTSSNTVRAVWLADLDPARVQPGPGRFVFVPGSAVDDIDGRFEIEAAGCSPGVLRTSQFATDETDEGHDVQVPVVEGEMRVVRHPPRGLSVIVRQGSPVNVQEKT